MSPTNIAIAEITIFAFIYGVQLITRYLQEWKYWHHNKRRAPARCFMYSFWGLIGVLAQLRIAGFAMVLACPEPSKGVVIAESVLQGIGLSPLLFEVSFVLLRCGQSRRTGPGNSRFPKHTRFMLHFFRFPIIIAIVLAVVGGVMHIRPCVYVGTVVLIVTFIFVCGLVGWFATRLRNDLSKAGHQGVLLVLAALPFLAVRVVYFLLAQYSVKFNPVHGDEGVMVGMGFLMEVIIAGILLTARAVIEPIWSDIEGVDAQV